MSKQDSGRLAEYFEGMDDAVRFAIKQTVFREFRRRGALLGRKPTRAEAHAIVDEMMRESEIDRAC
ncbi:MAG: hypothetical protein O7A04_09345 [Acidobacteria bacterium]|nr:hypothetical protein [Acidobacteriota bacterium]